MAKKQGLYGIPVYVKAADLRLAMMMRIAEANGISFVFQCQGENPNGGPCSRPATIVSPPEGAPPFRSEIDYAKALGRRGEIVGYRILCRSCRAAGRGLVADSGTRLPHAHSVPTYHPGEWADSAVGNG